MRCDFRLPVLFHPVLNTKQLPCTELSTSVNQLSTSKSYIADFAPDVYLLIFIVWLNPVRIDEVVLAVTLSPLGTL